ncbi:MAG: hypothetical protein ACYSUC_12220 [Planctomycetota bacterium]|jgi:hypothetical protein
MKCRKCRDAKRNRNRYATGKGRSDRMELEAMGRIGTSVYGMVADPLEGYVPRPRTRVEVWRRETG